MTLQYSVAVRNARLDAIETIIGTSPTLEIRSGAAPANCAAADSGTVLATLSLPSDWMGAASGGVKSLSGTWQDLVADAAGTVGHFRIKSSGAAVGMQGTVTATGGGGDLTVDDAVFAAGQRFDITSFDITGGNP
jgi:hypothetical protein